MTKNKSLSLDRTKIMSLYSDMSGATGDPLWKALADPTRRSIMETLGVGPRTTGDLVSRYAPTLTRTAVMKHLDVLEQAGLLRVERVGRSRWNHLQQTPLHDLSQWLKRRLLNHELNLQRLKLVAEAKARQGVPSPTDQIQAHPSS